MVGFSLKTAFSFCRRHIVSLSVCALVPVHEAVRVMWVLEGFCQPCLLDLTPWSPASVAYWSTFLLLFDLTVSASSLSSLSRLTRLVLVQYHLQFGVGVLFRHTVKNATVLPWCDTSIIFAMLPSLAHKMLRWKFSYRKCWDGHYCGNVQITPKYYFYLSNCAVKADKLNNSNSKMSEAGLMSYWESIINK